MSEELRPCPEGHDAHLHWEYDGHNEDGDERRFVSCQEVFCWIGPMGKTADDAIAAWNRRTADARVERMEKAWATVRSRIICTVDPACAEHDFRHAMDAVNAMDAALSPEKAKSEEGPQ